MLRASPIPQSFVQSAGVFLLALSAVPMQLLLTWTKSEDNVYNSPMTRHELENQAHFLVFCVHDITCIASCVLFLYLFFSKKDASHARIGRLCGINLCFTIISGF